MSCHFHLLLCFLFIVYAYVDENQRPENGAFQYQSSFNGPFGGTHIPFWETGGSAVVMDNYVRLTPNQQSQRGWIWTTRPMRNREWEIHVQFAIGSEGRIGADGMAIWYTKEKAQPGPVMGNIDRWTGIAIIIDTFDNDGQRDNPQIYAVYNDHSFSLNPPSDGKENTLGICQASVRQISANPENKFGKILIRFKEKTLYVAYDLSTVTGTEPGWTECLSAPVPIEDQLTGYYLGITAETGGLSDYHDVKSVTAWSIRTPATKPSDKEPNQPTSLQEEIENKKKLEEAANNNKIKDLNAKDIIKEAVKDAKGETVIRLKKAEGEDPAFEILTRLAELEKRDESLSSSMETKFKEMQQKLEGIERDQIQTLTKIQTGLEGVRSAVDVNRIEELKRDVKSALSALNNVQTRVNTIENHVEGANKKTDDLHGLHDARSTELRELVERSSSWGFWTYFLIFQVLFWGVFVWWKKTQDDKNKKFL